MKQIIFLTTILCLASHSLSAMEEREQWPARADTKMLQFISATEQWPECFQKLSFPGPDEQIHKEALLKANPFWKKVAETAIPEEKNRYLQKALDLPGGDPVWQYRRKAIGCALATGADPNSGFGLLNVIINNDYSLVKFALECNADPNIIYFDPTLFFAKTLRMAKLLVEHKANIFARGMGDQTILHKVANSYPHPAKLLPYYIQKGIGVNVKNRGYYTPIMYAIATGKTLNQNQKTKFKLLLEHGADVNIKNEDDENVWDLAHEHECYHKALEIYNQFQQECTAYGSLISRLRLFSNQS